MSNLESSIGKEIKFYIKESGWSLTNVIREMNKTRSKDKQTTTQNISNKLTRGTIKFSEVKEIASIIGYEIEWNKN